MITLAVVSAAAITVPHAIDWRRTDALTASVVWLMALVLRWLLVVSAVVYVAILLPHSGPFNTLTHWCWRAVVPWLATPLGLDGHRVGDTAVALPGGTLALSLLWAGFGIARAARALRHLVRRSGLGTGPDGSVIVGGSDVLFMAAGLMRPKVVVSAGTLLLLDDAELAAGLDHERAHIRRGHRFVLLVGELCGTTARLLPGTRRAVAELAFHLERDADRWVLARRHDPLALASAICKAATSCVQTSAVLTPLGGGYVTARLEELTNADPPHRAYRRVAMRTLAAVMASLALALLAVLPTAAMAGLRQPDHGADMPHCRR